MRLGKVILNAGYVVDLDNEEMVQHARDAVFDDIVNAVKFNELDCWIKVIEASNAIEEDIPEFLLEDEED